MAQASLPSTIRTGDQRSAAKVQANDEALRDALNALTDDNVAGAGFSAAALSDALAVILGLTKGTTVRRGKVNITTEQTGPSGGYGLMSTPDRVQGVVVPTDGWLIIGYQAMWTQTGTGGKAALFIGSNQLKFANDRTNAAPVVQETLATATYKPLVSTPGGLYGVAGDATDYTGDVTTGQILGLGVNSSFNGTPTATAGFTIVNKLAAGSYDVSVQTTATTGGVKMKNRLLQVLSVGF